jgi:hypothetical protein
MSKVVRWAVQAALVLLFAGYFESLTPGNNEETWCQFHQHFMSRFCIDILLPKNKKAKLVLKKSWAKHFRTKKAHVKC